jgi:hypothetical protein
VNNFKNSRNKCRRQKQSSSIATYSSSLKYLQQKRLESAVLKQLKNKSRSATSSLFFSFDSVSYYFETRDHLRFHFLSSLLKELEILSREFSFRTTICAATKATSMGNALFPSEISEVSDKSILRRALLTGSLPHAQASIAAIKQQQHKAAAELQSAATHSELQAIIITHLTTPLTIVRPAVDATAAAGGPDSSGQQQQQWPPPAAAAKKKRKRAFCKDVRSEKGGKQRQTMGCFIDNVIDPDLVDDWQSNEAKTPLMWALDCQAPNDLVMFIKDAISKGTKSMAVRGGASALMASTTATTSSSSAAGAGAGNANVNGESNADGTAAAADGTAAAVADEGHSFNRAALAKQRLMHMRTRKEKEMSSISSSSSSTNDFSHSYGSSSGGGGGAGNDARNEVSNQRGKREITSHDLVQGMSEEEARMFKKFQTT